MAGGGQGEGGLFGGEMGWVGFVGCFWYVRMDGWMDG